MLILPRQARDKQGKALKKSPFSRSDCNNRTALPPNGADAILPTSCGNVHVARFKLTAT
jgi:hypothetical protein